MTPQNNLDVEGDFSVNPFAELLVEIIQARLTGALRLSDELKKTIIYFREGSVVFGVSNAREHRLLNRLLNSKQIERRAIADISGLSNDIEFAAGLLSKELLTKEEVEDAVVSQINDIIIDALTWAAGKWQFSPLSRLRADVVYRVEIDNILLNYARCLSGETVLRRFRSVKEGFVRRLDVADGIPLQTNEANVLQNFGNVPVNFDELRRVLDLAEATLAQALYALWLGGIVLRTGWNKAFTEARVADIKRARYSKVKDAPAIPEIKKPAVEPAPLPEAAPEPAKLPEVFLTLEEWLDRVENARTHYDVLAIAENSTVEQIKNSYFSLAKLFHPDRYHRESSAALRLIEVAFTRLAQAYETLKTHQSRESYDYKIKTEFETREKRKSAGEVPPAGDTQSELALDSFEQGLHLLNEEEFGAAAAHLARAVHYNSQNALYRAYYGKALSADNKQQHKAESEMQAASKLDPQNPKIRLMLIQFFLDRNLRKRAEGELKRFLEIAPDNNEARSLLAGLQVQT